MLMSACLSVVVSLHAFTSRPRCRLSLELVDVPLEAVGVLLVNQAPFSPCLVCYRSLASPGSVPLPQLAGAPMSLVWYRQLSP